MKKKIILIILTALVLLLAGCSKQPEKYSHSQVAMGTVVSETIYVDSVQDFHSEIPDILNSLEKLELSRREPNSEIGRLNAQSGETVTVSQNLAEILRVCKTIYGDSNGAMDITLGRLISLWEIDEKAAGTGVISLPEQSEILRASELTGFHRVLMDKTAITMPEGMQLDLGAVGKGIAMDRIASYLQGETRIRSAIISLGGAVLTYGEKADGTAWNIQVADPLEPSQSIGTLQLKGVHFVSTSGDYERYFEYGGERYHHILDPTTGYPADSGLAGVTIVADNGLISDALSTACFVLGEEKGMDLVEKYGAEALFVDKEGNIRMTAGMSGLFRENHQ